MLDWSLHTKIPIKKPCRLFLFLSWKDKRLFSLMWIGFWNWKFAEKKSRGNRSYEYVWMDDDKWRDLWWILWYCQRWIASACPLCICLAVMWKSWVLQTLWGAKEQGQREDLWRTLQQEETAASGRLHLEDLEYLSLCCYVFTILQPCYLESVHHFFCIPCMPLRCGSRRIASFQIEATKTS